MLLIARGHYSIDCLIGKLFQLSLTNRSATREILVCFYILIEFSSQFSNIEDYQLIEPYYFGTEASYSLIFSSLNEFYTAYLKGSKTLFYFRLLHNDTNVVHLPHHGQHFKLETAGQTQLP